MRTVCFGLLGNPVGCFEAFPSRSNSVSPILETDRDEKTARPRHGVETPRELPWAKLFALCSPTILSVYPS